MRKMQFIRKKKSICKILEGKKKVLESFQSKRISNDLRLCSLLSVNCIIPGMENERVGLCKRLKPAKHIIFLH